MTSEDHPDVVDRRCRASDDKAGVEVKTVEQMFSRESSRDAVGPGAIEGVSSRMEAEAHCVFATPATTGRNDR